MNSCAPLNQESVNKYIYIYIYALVAGAAGGGLLHVGVLCSQSWDGDLVEEELSLVWTDGGVELIDGLTPVILLTQLLQNLTDR